MKEINLKFGGKIFIEDWEFNKNCPGIREEEDRVKIFDSVDRYLDYFTTDAIEETSDYAKITPQQWIDNLIKSIEELETIESLLDFLCIEYDVVSKDWKEIATHLLDPNEDDFTEKGLMRNEYVNKVGDWFVLVVLLQ